MSQFHVSLAGIALVTLIAWFVWGRRAPAPLREEEARRIAAGALPGFRPHRAVCGQRNRGALVEGAGGEIALVRPHGDHWTVRRIEAGAKASFDGEILIVRPAEPMFAPLRLDLAETAARNWLKRIEEARDGPA